MKFTIKDDDEEAFAKLAAALDRAMDRLESAYA
jgi:hypothetical protein